MLNWDKGMELNVSLLDHTHSKREQEWRLNEAMADDTKLSQHSTIGTEKTVEKETTYRTPKGTEKQLDYILEDRRTLKRNRHDPHGKRPQKCYGTIRDYNTKERKSHKKTHTAKKNMQTAESTKSQDDEKTRSDEAIKFEEGYAELERKNQA